MKTVHYQNDRMNTYWFGTKGVILTFGCTTRPIAKIPPPFFPSKQWANIFFTFPDEASCEIIEEFDFPKPSIPSSAPSPDEPRSPDCVAPHLLHKSQNNHMNTNNILMHMYVGTQSKIAHVRERERDCSSNQLHNSLCTFSSFNTKQRLLWE